MIKEMFEKDIQLFNLLRDEYIGKIKNLIDVIVNALRKENKILLAGNGGSASQSQHIAAELVSKFKMERRALGAIALTTDTSIITAQSNDYGYDFIFARQIEALAKEGDVFIGLSTSGNSVNIVEAIKQAKERRVKTVALLGSGGGKIKDLVELEITIPSNDTPRIQECHLTILHIVCEIVERDLFS